MRTERRTPAQREKHPKGQAESRDEPPCEAAGRVIEGRLTMGRRLRFIALLVATFAVCARANARPAKQTWLRIQAPHFVVITDGMPRQAMDVAERFEAIREVFLKASRMHVDPPTPVVILAARNGKALGKLLPGYWGTKGRAHPAGIFVSAPGHNYVALRMDVDQYSDYHVIYHEYVHLLERLNFTSLPTWLSEGFAEFYGSVRIKRGEVDLGYPIAEHIETLKQGQWIPLDQLLTATESSPYYNENDLAGIFYAESWELTDYLLVGKKGALTPELGKYLGLFEQGKPSLAAARQAFGHLKALTKILHNYARRPVFNYMRVHISIGRGKTRFPSTVLTPAEADAIFGDFYADTGEPADARTALNQAIQLNPQLPAPYVTLGMLALRAGDRKAELKWFGRAIALGSKSYLPYFYRANALANRSGGAALPQVESDLNQCLKLNPSFGGAYSVLAELYAENGVKLSQANALAHRAIELEPASSFDHLVLGMVLLRQGQAKAAQAEAIRALFLAHTSLDREQAQTFMGEVWSSGIVRTTAAANASAHGKPSTGNSLSEPVEPSKQPEARLGANSSIPAASIIAQGTVRRAQCAAAGMKFLLMVNGSGVPLIASNAAAVQYSGFSALAKGASRCSQIEGRKVTVRFRPVSGEPYTGEVLEIDRGR